MDGCIFGIIAAIVFIYGNDAAKIIMSKVHQNNQEKMAKLKIPGYAIYSYIMFIRDRKNETEGDNG